MERSNTGETFLLQIRIESEEKGLKRATAVVTGSEAKLSVKHMDKTPCAGADDLD